MSILYTYVHSGGHFRVHSVCKLTKHNRIGTAAMDAPISGMSRSSRRTMPTWDALQVTVDRVKGHSVEVDWVKVDTVRVDRDMVRTQCMRSAARMTVIAMWSYWVQTAISQRNQLPIWLHRTRLHRTPLLIQEH